MSISEALYETMRFCSSKNLEFRLITGGPDKNSYIIDQENKIVTITIIDEKDIELDGVINNKLLELKDIFK